MVTMRVIFCFSKLGISTYFSTSNMITSISRLILRSNRSTTKLPLRYLGDSVPVVKRWSDGRDQLDFIKTVEPSTDIDWTTIRRQVLDIPGSITQKNFDGVILKYLAKKDRLNVALSFADYLKKSGELSIGSINGILVLYYVIGLKNQLTDEMKSFILEMYQYLYDKYKVLDTTTSESLIHALCVVDEWEKAIKVLDNVVLNKPSHSAYSTIIATLFKLNKKKEALKMVERSINEQRPLQHRDYEQWINFILRSYNDKKNKIKHLEGILVHISKNYVLIPECTAAKIDETFSSLGWKANVTKISKESGQCYTCKESLDLLKLSDEEFSLLQNNVKEKLIVGSDLFLTTSPKELQRFLNFVDETAPYDIVIDALNVAFSVTNGSNYDRCRRLCHVVQHFNDRNKKVLLLGRKYMLKWPKLSYILGSTNNFFIDDLSQDDPFFITAAILSGPRADIVSRDHLRDHKCQLGDVRLRSLFRRWQWQHQWMVFTGRGKQPFIQPPLPVTPCAQSSKRAWHLPFAREGVGAAAAGPVLAGVPDWGTWLCLAPPG